MIERYRERYGYLPETLAADTTYGNGELLQWLDERGIAAYIRVKENPNGSTDLYGIEKFRYIPEENCYICPEGKILKYVGINARNRTHIYYSTVKRCRECSQKSRCTRGKYRTLAIHTCERAAACARPRSDTRIRYLATGAAKSRSTVRRAKELHRTTPTKAAPDAFVREQFY